MRRSHFRRCMDCQNKTHRRFWIDERCPVCDKGTVYKESWHGGLTETQISEAKKKLQKAINEIEGMNFLRIVERR